MIATKISKPVYQLQLQPNKITYQPHQEYGIDELVKSVLAGEYPLLVVPTGGGKSYTAVGMARVLLELGWSVLFCFPYSALPDQFMSSAIDVGIPKDAISKIWADKTSTFRQLAQSRVCVAMVQTLCQPGRLRELNTFLHEKKVVVFYDEWDVSAFSSAGIMLRNFPSSGGTATPYRGGGGVRLDLHRVISPITMKQLISRGTLCPYVIESFPGEINLSHSAAPKNAKDPERLTRAERMSVVRAAQAHFVLDKWRQKGFGWPTFAAMPSQDSAREYCRFFNESGVPSEVIFDLTANEEREKILDRLEAGVTKVVFSVDAIAAGVDRPAASVLIVLQIWRGPRKAAQYVGRVVRALRPRTAKGKANALRTHGPDGKKIAIILDFAQNYLHSANPRALDPPCEVDWLEIQQPRGRDCEVCGHTSPSSAKQCYGCDATFPEKDALIYELVCDSCGHVNPDTARKCGGCGEPLFEIDEEDFPADEDDAPGFSEEELVRVFESVDIGDSVRGAEFSVAPNPMTPPPPGSHLSPREVAARRLVAHPGLGVEKLTKKMPPEVLAFRKMLRNGVFKKNQSPDVLLIEFEKSGLVADFRDPLAHVAAIYHGLEDVSSVVAYQVLLESASIDPIRARFWLLLEFGDRLDDLLDQAKRARRAALG